MSFIPNFTPEIAAIRQALAAPKDPQSLATLKDKITEVDGTINAIVTCLMEDQAYAPDELQRLVEFHADLIQLNETIATQPALPFFNVATVGEYITRVKQASAQERTAPQLVAPEPMRTVARDDDDEVAYLVNTLLPLMDKYDEESALLYVASIELLQRKERYLSGNPLLDRLQKEAECYRRAGLLKDILDRDFPEPASSIITKKTMALMATLDSTEKTKERVSVYLSDLQKQGVDLARFKNCLREDNQPFFNLLAEKITHFLPPEKPPANLEEFCQKRHLTQVERDLLFQLVNTLTPLLDKQDGESARLYMLSMENLRLNPFFPDLQELLSDNPALSRLLKEAAYFSGTGKLLRNTLEQQRFQDPDYVITKKTVALMATLGPRDSNETTARVTAYLTDLQQQRVNLARLKRCLLLEFHPDFVFLTDKIAAFLGEKVEGPAPAAPATLEEFFKQREYLTEEEQGELSRLINDLTPYMDKYDAEAAARYTFFMKDLWQNPLFHTLTLAFSDNSALGRLLKQAECYRRAGVLKKILERQGFQEFDARIITKKTLALMADLGSNPHEDERISLYLIDLQEQGVDVARLKRCFAIADGDRTFFNLLLDHLRE